MNLFVIIGLMWVAAAGAGGGGYGAAATNAEMAEAKAWAAPAFQAAAPLLSFSYEGCPSTDVLAKWDIKMEESPTAAGQTAGTVTFTDPETRLEVRCAVIEYTDLPAVEWLVTLRNGGDKDTPIFDGIRPLDWSAPWSEGGVTVHYGLGDSNSEKSFEPVDKTLAPNEPEPFVLAPEAGRSSEGYMPFFNIEGKGRGVAMAVG